jgi:signal transduction histidine kinase
MNMRSKWLFWTLICWFIPQVLFAQSTSCTQQIIDLKKYYLSDKPERDSLDWAIRVAENCGDDGTRIDFWINAGYSFSDAADSTTNRKIIGELQKGKDLIITKPELFNNDQAGDIYFYLALAQFTSNDYPSAIKNYASAAVYWKERPDPYYLAHLYKNLALCYVGIAEAIALTSDNSSSAIRRKAETYYKLAIENAESSPYFTKWEFLRMQVFLSSIQDGLGQKDNAKQSLIPVLKTREILIEKNECDFDQPKEDSCKAYLEVFLESWILESRLDIEDGKYKKADSILQRVYKSGNLLGSEWGKNLATNAAYQLGRLALKRGNAQRAISYFSSAQDTLQKYNYDKQLEAEILEELIPLQIPYQSKEWIYAQNQRKEKIKLDLVGNGILDPQINFDEAQTMNIQSLKIQNNKIQSRNLFLFILFLFAILLFGIIFILVRNRYQQNLRSKEIEIELKENQIKRVFEEMRERVIKARANTINEISYNIHNGLGQDLIALKYDFAFLIKKIEPIKEELLEVVNELNSSLNNLSEAAQGYSRALHQRELKSGIKKELENLAQSYKRRGDLDIELEFHGDSSLEFPSGLEFDLYYLIQEAITNALKHGKADKILISFLLTSSKNKENQSHELFVKIKDNGEGIERTTMGKGLGLQSMSENAKKYNGEFEFRPMETGTEITFSFPLNLPKL